MRLTLVASLVLSGFICSGCESLRKTARHWPGKTPGASEQLAIDQQRREAAEKQTAQGNPTGSDVPAIQKTNLAPADPLSATLLRAKQAEQARQNQVAKSLYEQVLQQQPQNAEAHHRLGVLADQDGRYPEAQQHYQSALKQQPQNASLLSDIGYSLYSQDRLDEAEQYLTSALQLQPENQYARNNLAQVYGRRATQTGSPSDYKLAQEQFTLALGPQGAEQQMQQLFPQAAAATGERRGLLPNPFKKKGGQEKSQSRMASNLEAPDPQSNDGNSELLRQMAEIRAQMIANGEIPPKRPPVPTPNTQRPALTGTPQNVPYDQMNNVLSRIDQEAANRQAIAQRRAYPNLQRGANSATQTDWNSTTGIERTAGEYANPAAEPASYRTNQDGSVMGPQDRFNSSMPILSGQGGQPAGQNDFGARGPGQVSSSPANGGQGQYGAVAPSSDPTESQGWNQEPSGMSQSWPDRAGSPTQFNARGQAWDGQTLMNNPNAVNSANLAYDASDPTYNSANGRSFGAQRPTGVAGAGPRGRGRPGNGSAGWDDGRQTAAQLGLDAGMGDMFPGGGDQGLYERNPSGNSVYPAGGDPSMYGDSTGQRGMSAGGMRNVAPADYNSPPAGYQNPGAGNSSWGQNSGYQGGDGGAPWNQTGMSPRNSRSAPQGQYGNNQYGNNGGQAQGRFAPPSGQEFGGQPMYYDR